MIKSAILFSGNVKLKVIVISDLPLINGFEEKVSSCWFHPINFTIAYFRLYTVVYQVYFILSRNAGLQFIKKHNGIGYIGMYST